MKTNDYFFWGSDPAIEKAYTHGKVYEDFIRWAFKKESENRQNGADACYMCDLIRAEHEISEGQAHRLQIVKTHVNRALDQLLFRVEGNFVQDTLIQLKIQTHKAIHSEQLIEIIHEALGLLGPKKMTYN
ncbi:hypothetical protein QNI19_31260 [Cytophagaceae bacterium DM2B3-1]|uniref:Uncharacterized protein n=1 Tax=Xanthocytophaga flava TaxID=3048013 RepID=A0AAE3QWT1_9BACT|nr:hypothetical protein [Xanthocytophaga flavus]MDJ1484955.1 hypothetical protein [Xanthocytophaga flavus]MDJ1497459.1 hypothetical protein [Xanthocytophaga flavus]